MITLRFLIFSLILSGAVEAQENDTIKKSLELSKEAGEVEYLISKFENLHKNLMLADIKELLGEKFKGDYQLLNAPKHNDDSNNPKYTVIDSIKINKSTGSTNSLVRVEVSEGNTKYTRHYFLLKENDQWKIQLVTPSKLDDHFRRIICK